MTPVPHPHTIKVKAILDLEFDPNTDTWQPTDDSLDPYPLPLRNWLITAGACLAPDCAQLRRMSSDGTAGSHIDAVNSALEAVPLPTTVELLTRIGAAVHAAPDASPVHDHPAARRLLHLAELAAVSADRELGDAAREIVYALPPVPQPY